MINPDIINAQKYSPPPLERHLSAGDIRSLTNSEPSIYLANLNIILEPPLPDPTCPVINRDIPGSERLSGSKVIRTIPCHIDASGTVILGVPNPQEAGVSPMDSGSLIFIRVPGFTEDAIQPLIIAYSPSTQGKKDNVDAWTLCNSPGAISTFFTLGELQWLNQALFLDPGDQGYCYDAQNARIPITLTMEDGSIRNIMIGVNGPKMLLFNGESLAISEFGALLFGDGDPVSHANLAMEELLAVASGKSEVDVTTFALDGVDFSPLGDIPVYTPPTVAPIYTEVPATAENSDFVNPQVVETPYADVTPIPEFEAVPLTPPEIVQTIRGDEIRTNISADHTANIKVTVVNTTLEYGYAHRLFKNITEIPTSESIFADIKKIEKRLGTWGQIKDAFYNFFHKVDRLPEPANILDTKDGFNIQGIEVLFFKHNPITNEVTVIARHGNQGGGLIIQTDLDTWTKFSETTIVDAAGNVDEIKTALFVEYIKDLGSPKTSDVLDKGENDAHFSSPGMPYSFMNFSYSNLVYENTHTSSGQEPKTGFVINKQGSIYTSSSIPHDYHGRPTGSIYTIGNDLYMVTAVDPIANPEMIAEGTEYVCIRIEEVVMDITNEAILKMREQLAPATP